MTCGGNFSGGCGSYSFVGSGSVCGGSLVKPPVSSCGVSISCGSSTPTKKNNNNENVTNVGVFTPNVRTIYVYDVDVDSRTASCLIDNFKDGEHNYKKKEVEFDKLRKFVKKGNFDAYELKGFRIKKDGEFKIKTKELKANKDMLENEVEDFKSHFNHMKDVKKELKAEREIDENEEDMER